MERLELLRGWVAGQFPGQGFELAPASVDASFRRYFRASFADRSLIAMDAPPKLEDCRPFIRVAQLFAEAGVNVPRVLAHNLEQGFLLLTDLDRTTYLEVLASDPDALYIDAIDALIRIQSISRAGVLPDYDEALLLREMRLFRDWYVPKHLQKTLSSAQAAALDGSFAAIARNNLAQPKVFVHRDYHSRNLMMTAPNPGILDFQDAVYGPITYDLVSLLKDAYIAWDEEQVLDWSVRYWEKARRAGLPVAADFAVFYRDFEWMGVQRHLKVLGIFARLYHRDGKSGYLKDMPLVASYLRKACQRYSDLAPLVRLIDELEDRGAARIGYTF